METSDELLLESLRPEGVGKREFYLMAKYLVESEELLNDEPQIYRDGPVFSNKYDCLDMADMVDELNMYEGCNEYPLNTHDFYQSFNYEDVLNQLVRMGGTVKYYPATYYEPAEDVYDEMEYGAAEMVLNMKAERENIEGNQDEMIDRLGLSYENFFETCSEIVKLAEQSKNPEYFEIGLEDKQAEYLVNRFQSSKFPNDSQERYLEAIIESQHLKEITCFTDCKNVDEWYALQQSVGRYLHKCWLKENNFGYRVEQECLKMDSRVDGKRVDYAINHDGTIDGFIKAVNAYKDNELPPRIAELVTGVAAYIEKGKQNILAKVEKTKADMERYNQFKDFVFKDDGTLFSGCTYSEKAHLSTFLENVDKCLKKAGEKRGDTFYKNLKGAEVLLKAFQTVERKKPKEVTVDVPEGRSKVNTL